MPEETMHNTIGEVDSSMGDHGGPVETVVPDVADEDNTDEDNTDEDNTDEDDTDEDTDDDDTDNGSDGTVTFP